MLLVLEYWNEEPKSVRVHTRQFVCFWHLADNPTAPIFVRNWTKSGQISLRNLAALSVNDLKRTCDTCAKWGLCLPKRKFHGSKF